MDYPAWQDPLTRPETCDPLPGLHGLSPHLEPARSTLSWANAWVLAGCAHLAYFCAREQAVELGRLGMEPVLRFGEEPGAGFIAGGGGVSVLAFAGSRGVAADMSTDRGFGRSGGLPAALGELAGPEPLVLPISAGGESASSLLGVHSALEVVWDEIRDALLARGEPVWMTGHGTGGAMASLAAVLMPAAGLYIFGAPAVGNRALVGLLRDTPAFRFVLGSDPVCAEPREGSLMGHAGEAVYITGDGARHSAPKRSRGLGRLLGSARATDHAIAGYCRSIASALGRDAGAEETPVPIRGTQ